MQSPQKILSVSTLGARMICEGAGELWAISVETIQRAIRNAQSHLAQLGALLAVSRRGAFGSLYQQMRF